MEALREVMPELVEQPRSRIKEGEVNTIRQAYDILRLDRDLSP